MTPHFVRASKIFNGNFTQFGGVIFHGLMREIAGQRRERGISGLLVQLKQIDQARAKRGIARFQKASDVFDPVSPNKCELPGESRQNDDSENQRQQKSQPPAGVKMKNYINDEHRQNRRADMFHAAQPEPSDRFFLMRAVGGSKPVQDVLRFVQHKPQRLRKNQSSPNSSPAR